jgi:hypothetical protein
MSKHLIRAIIIIIAALVTYYLFTACSSEPQVDTELPVPDMYERIGHTSAQIQYWHKNELKDMVLDKNESELLTYHKNVDANFILSYEFKDNKCISNGIEVKAYTLENLEARYLSLLYLIKDDFGFTQTEKKEKTETTFFVIISKPSKPGIECSVLVKEEKGSSTQAYTILAKFYKTDKSTNSGIRKVQEPVFSFAVGYSN